MSNEYAIGKLEDIKKEKEEDLEYWKKWRNGEGHEQQEEIHKNLIHQLQSAIDKLQADDKVIELCEECMAKRIIKLSENGGIPI